MFNYQNIMRIVVIGLVLLFGTSAMAAEKQRPSGKITIDQTEFGFIIGGRIGDGVLQFKGKKHHFKMNGLSVGTVGVSRMGARGEVYNLTDVSQFPGTYAEAEASIAVGGGVGGLVLKNENGVVLSLHSTLQGVSLTLGVQGLKVSLE